MWIEAIKAHVGDGSFLLVSRWLHEEGHWLMFVVMAAPECPAGASARRVEEAGVAKTCGRDVALVLDRVQPQAPPTPGTATAAGTAAATTSKFC